MTDRSDEIDFAARLTERERAASISRIRTALNGSSGRLVCDCGEPIGEARRQAMPNADTCINCATFAEKQRRRAS